MYENDELLYTQEDMDEWMRTCQNLQEHLKEQEEEIEEYNNYFKSFGCKNFAEFQELIGLTKISANDKERDYTIRKQVCDEIRERASFVNEKHNIDFGEICTILDQIAKGEE